MSRMLFGAVAALPILTAGAGQADLIQPVTDETTPKDPASARLAGGALR